MSRPDKSQIEPRFKASIDRWVSDRLPTGQFLQAVLENNLREAIGRGDDAAIDNLPHIVAYLYNDCDMRCWGSPERVAAWSGTDEERELVRIDEQAERDAAARDRAEERKTDEALDRARGIE